MDGLNDFQAYSIVWFNGHCAVIVSEILAHSSRVYSPIPYFSFHLSFNKITSKLLLHTEQVRVARWLM